jgi:lipoprotein signal peptidase
MSGQTISEAPVASLRAVPPPSEPRRRWLVFGVLAAVIVIDQAAKWWAWRHVRGAEINPGGDFLVGHAVGELYSKPVTGAVLDLLDFGLLSLAVALLARRRRPAVVAVPCALMLGGWVSNLLDRLGMHYWTAPGSVRGAVDFMHIAGSNYNGADFFIIGATPVFLLAAGWTRWRAVSRPARVRVVAPAARTRPHRLATMPALAGAAVIMAAVVLGAANDGGVSAAPAHLATKSDVHARSAAVVALPPW